MPNNDDRVIEAREKRIIDVASGLGISGLRRVGSEHVGGCPVCGNDGKIDADRFQLVPEKNIFSCRRCDASGDPIALVQFVKACGFPDALEYLVGAKAVAIPPEELARRERQQKRNAERGAREQRQRSEYARKQGHAIWMQGAPALGSPVVDYLALRGLTGDAVAGVIARLRFDPALPYMVNTPAGWLEIHRGPAMLAPIIRPDGTFGAVHRTWLDLDRPKGKAVIEHEGNRLDVKKGWGSKKGGTIRLLTPDSPEIMIMGEGIETTLSALVAAPMARAAYWAGVDLGNMSGKRKKGKGLKYAGIPDLGDDRAFVPPSWVRHLIFLQDGDSEPKLTRAQLLSGLRRARALLPDCPRIQIVRAQDGKDLNDMILEGRQDE